MFKKWLLVAVGWSAMGLSFIEAKDQPAKISVTVARETVGYKAIVNFSVDRSASIFEADLPWGNFYSLTLVAVSVPREAYAGEPLISVFMEDNPSAAQIVLEKNRVYSGAINLKEHFANLEEVVKKRDVVIFWSYQVKFRDGGVSERVGGFFVIEKGS